MSKPVTERQPENRWTPEEDEVLIAAIEQCGSVIVWSQVSACLPGRNNKSCRKRWIHSLDPTLRKGRWTEDEDTVLISAVETYGTHWFQVAKLLPGRTDDQCAKRWRENLDPSISRKAWTKNEDEILMDTFEKIGKRWKDIASCFEGRPPVHCRNRVQSLVRARKRAAKVRTVGKSKIKSKRPTYDAVMNNGNSLHSSSVDSWVELGRRTPSTFENPPDSFDLESVSSGGSPENSIYPLTPHLSDTPSQVFSRESSSPLQTSASESFVGHYPSPQPTQLFYHDSSPPSSSPLSSLEWTPSIDNGLSPQLGLQWGKPLPSHPSNLDTNFMEWFSNWAPSQSEGHLLSNTPSLSPLNSNSGDGFQSQHQQSVHGSRHPPYHTPLSSQSYAHQSPQLATNSQDAAASHRPWLAQQNSHVSTPRCSVPPPTSTPFSSALMF